MTLAVFVNSSDGFQDCWIPFFTLFRIYGGALRDLPVYLNTERAQFIYDGVDVQSTRVWSEDETIRPSWSDCLLRGLNAVKENYILYFQEDYFFNRSVRDEIIEEALHIFETIPNTGVVYLSPNGPKAGKSRPYSRNFFQVCPPAHYLINTQAAIWDKEYLSSLVRGWENAWMFEKFATQRARSTQRGIYAPTSKVLLNCVIIDYVWSGIIRGKWKDECVELFRKHGIAMDFDKRGFYREGNLLRPRLEALQKLFGRPVPALRSILTLFRREPNG